MLKYWGIYYSEIVNFSIPILLQFGHFTLTLGFPFALYLIPPISQMLDIVPQDEQVNIHFLDSSSIAANFSFEEKNLVIF